ncbi:hypothetical protein AVEN_67922-1 [Araneus ventricosus]|uniref:Uncharacterized protein n=1 Tax=Araneus ventricosus TaxID=182803 RepID=A0A4Y2T701_ARAVE|nr:hypothetical protein AVEN_67922-1 [Araneus ventricosus]
MTWVGSQVCRLKPNGLRLILSQRSKESQKGIKSLYWINELGRRRVLLFWWIQVPLDIESKLCTFNTSYDSIVVLSIWNYSSRFHLIINETKRTSEVYICVLSNQSLSKHLLRNPRS